MGSETRILCNICKFFVVQCSVRTEFLPRNADAAQKHSHNHIGNYFCEIPHGFEHEPQTLCLL